VVSATDRNIQTLAAEARRVRDEVGALAMRMDALEKRLLALSRDFDAQRQQTGMIMARFLGGGPTHGDD
jgi:hypothetical protein